MANNREELDRILLLMQSIDLVKVAPEERTKIVEMLARLRAMQPAEVSKDAISADGQDAKAIGSQAVQTDGDVSGIINTGEVVNIFYHQYLIPSGDGDLDEKEFRRVLEKYLEWVITAYDKARLYGVGGEVIGGKKNPREIPRRRLSDVFVPLNLRRFSPLRRSEVEELSSSSFSGHPNAQQLAYLRAVESHRSSGEEVILNDMLTIHDRLAIIGGAGSGKSALSAYLASGLARAAVSGKPPDFQLPKDRKQLLPLVIPLRYFGEYKRLIKSVPGDRLTGKYPGTLAGFIIWHLMRSVLPKEFSQDFFERMLMGGNCLLILDGLDEVVNRADRSQMRNEVEKVIDIYSDNMIIVTARECGYSEDAVFEDDFTRLDVQPFKDNQIEALVYKWCQQLYETSVESHADKLVQAIRHVNKIYEAQELPRLISTPLMTTMVLSVSWNESELPRQRAELYEAAVKVILRAQYLDADDARQELVDLGGVDWQEQRDWLSCLAFEMHNGGPNDTAIPEEAVRRILSEKLGLSIERVNTFIEAVRHRGGLLEERAELFQFTHLTFQEFLAARYAVKHRQASFPDLQPHISEPWWREVFLLVFGFAKIDHRDFAIEYINWLSGKQDHDHALALAGLELSAAASEIEPPDTEARQEIAKKLCGAFEHHDQNTSAVSRYLAGNTLATLGDPRFDPACWYLPKQEFFGFIRVPTGKFIMGHDFYSNYPFHEHTIHYDYWMAKYPITVAEYRVFVEEAHYDFHRWEYNQNPNHPVVCVNWYDAMAYCDWLKTRLKFLANARGRESQFSTRPWVSSLIQCLVNERFQVTLPSEPEWEKAARGTDGRTYPWGEDENPAWANYEHTGLGTTSTVGAFPGGRSPFGLMDMVGNVYEWSRDPWVVDYDCSIRESLSPALRSASEEVIISDSRVLRGGCFKYADGARCAYRYGELTGYLSNQVGFRPVLIPFSITT